MKYICLIVIYMGVNNIIAGQDSVFTIQSFKPENIRDSQILIRFDNRYSKSSGEGNEINGTKEEEVNDAQQSNFTTSVNWKFKYETPKILLYTDINTMFDYYNRHSDYSSAKDDAIPEQPIHSYYEKNSRSKNFRERIDFTLLGSRYFLNKLGILTYSKMSLNMTQYDLFSKYEDIRFNTKDYSPSLRQRFSERDNENSEKNGKLKVMVGPFYGKIYEGYYAAKTIELISELSAKGQLIFKPSANQMKKLTQIIYEEMNHYYYDSRIKRVESLKRITAWLVSENIIEDSITPFLTIMDIYEYSIQRKRRRYNSSEFLPSQTYYRPHGFNIGVLIGGAYSETNEINRGFKTDISYNTIYDSLWQIVDLDTFDTSESYDEKKISNGSSSKEISLFLEYARPFGWHWQLNTSIVISVDKTDTTNLHWLGDGITTQPYVYDYGYGCKENRKGKSKAAYPLSASVDLRLQYFMNSRTKFDLLFSTDYSKANNLFSKTNYSITDSGYVITIIPFEKNYKSLYFNTGFSSTYYFTPRISINGYIRHYFRKIWDMNYTSNHDLFDSLNFLREKSKSNSFHFSVRVNYYIM